MVKGSSLLLTHEAFPFDKMVPGIADPEMDENTARIINEAIKDKVQVNLIINNRVGGNRSRAVSPPSSSRLLPALPGAELSEPI
jgi:hypothetical protein